MLDFLSIFCVFCSVVVFVSLSFWIFFSDFSSKSDSFFSCVQFVVKPVHWILFFLIYFWLRWVFIAARRLSLVAASGGYSLLQCVGFSLRWLLLLRSTGSRRVGFSSRGSGALERGLSSCGAWTLLLRGMWDLPGPGLEPVSPALAGRFLTTAPPGRPPVHWILNFLLYFLITEFTFSSFLIISSLLLSSHCCF